MNFENAILYRNLEIIKAIEVVSFTSQFTEGFE